MIFSDHFVKVNKMFTLLLSFSYAEDFYPTLFQDFFIAKPKKPQEKVRIASHP